MKPLQFNLQDVFTFVHPNREAIIDNSRYAALRFERAGRPAAVCHGLAGYFDAQVRGMQDIAQVGVQWKLGRPAARLGPSSPSPLWLCLTYQTEILPTLLLATQQCTLNAEEVTFAVWLAAVWRGAPQHPPAHAHPQHVQVSLAC